MSDDLLVHPMQTTEILQGEILRVTVGSEVHGVTSSAIDDHDEMGIFVPGAEYVLGTKLIDQYQWRSQPEGVRSGPGDTDLVVYSLRKWVTLALRGNPTVLLPMYVPDEHIRWITRSGMKLRTEVRPRLVSQVVKERYIGYVNRQMRRLNGETGGRHTNRPELITKYGFDTKYAYHMVRVAYQGFILWTTGVIPVPIPEPLRSHLIDLRHGLHTKEWAIGMAMEYLEHFEGPSVLPIEPDLNAVHEWMFETYMVEWNAFA